MDQEVESQQPNSPNNAFGNDQATPSSYDLNAFYALSVPEIMNAPEDILRLVLLQGPSSFHPVDSDSARDILAKAATLHATHNPKAVALRGEIFWTKLIGLTNKQIINLAAANTSDFANSLKDVIVFKPALSLPTGEENNLGGLASTAIEWVANAVQSNQNTTPTTELPLRQTIMHHTRPLPNNTEPLADRGDLPFLDISDAPRRQHTQPRNISTDIPSHFRHPKVLPLLRRLRDIKQTRFPTPDISVEIFRGPGILVGLLHRDTTLSHHVAKTHFTTLDNGRPGASEYEAVSLARSLDIRLGSYPTAYHFLANDLSAEVDLRRLYAIIKVESMVRIGWSRGDAWAKQMSMLETAPTNSTSYQDLDEEVNNM